MLAATGDGGRSWREILGPATELEPIVLASDTATVKAIAFADARNGWLYLPGLWATHDGGAHWSRVALNGAVGAITVAGGWAYAVVDATLGGITGSLWRSPVGRDEWQPVHGLQGRSRSAPGASC